MGRIAVPFRPKVRIRFVPYESDEQRRLLQDQLRWTQKPAEKIKSRATKGADLTKQVSLIDGLQEKSEPVIVLSCTTPYFSF